ncbi:MAG: dTDP-4-dehydrorhamnose reductase, partial [Anaerolineae bacterium]
MKPRRIVITGAGGQLATDLRKVLSRHDLIPLTHADLDICDGDAVRETLARLRPDIVINTAAFHRVDDCESQVERAFQVNVLGVENICQACARVDAALVHISTDYVFDGSKTQPYREEDAPAPINVYGISKLAGELTVRLRLERHFIVRSSGLFGSAGASGKGGNFVNTMLRKAHDREKIQVVHDQRLSPTYTRHLAAKIAWLVTTDHFGLFHITNADSCSWYEFASAIFELSGLQVELSPTVSAAFQAPARRPPNSTLAHGRLQALAADDLPTWRQALIEYLDEIGAARGSDTGRSP